MRYELSRREEDILQLLAEYQTYSNIGTKLGVSLKTVHNNVCSLMAKIGIHKKELLIKYAHEHGYGRKRVSA